MASVQPELRRLGRSDLLVTPLGLGTAALGVPYGAPGSDRPAPSASVARATVESAINAGVRFIDTAPAYGNAEAIVGAVSATSSCVVATKLAIPDEGWQSLARDEARDAVRRSVTASLESLRRDRIEVLQIHNADEAVLTHEGLLPALLELREEGVVKLIGATVYGEANALAAIAAPGIDLIQVAHNALDRRPEKHVLPRAFAASVAVTTRSALLRGVLSSAGRGLVREFRPLADAADAFRRASGATWEQLPGAALAWSANTPGVTTTVIGPRDPVELSQLLEGARTFADRVRDLPSGWERDVPEELLDPSRWPTLEAAT